MALFVSFLSILFVALTYVYLQFPVVDRPTTWTSGHAIRTPRHSSDSHQSRRHPHKASPQQHHTPAKDADGGILSEVAIWPQVEAKHPPRTLACHCYPQVKDAFVREGFELLEASDDYEHAWIIWKTGTDIPMEELQPWQRPNHFPGERQMDRKGTMYQVLRQFSWRTHTPLDFLPETYLLYDPTDKDRFLRRLTEEGGMDVPWVLKKAKASRGRGVTMMGPGSSELVELQQELTDGPLKKGHIVQRYIQNEWTYQGHKCDLRVYVLVASVDPLIVLYHDGIVRTAVGLHDESNFEESKAHLTNVSQNKQNRTQWEPVKTFGQLDEELKAYVQRPGVRVDTDDPVRHIRDQIKQILGVVFAAFKSRIYLSQGPDNAFALMGADFVIDDDLKVWLLEMQLGPQLVGDNHFEKIAVLRDVLTTTVDVVEEVFHKQVAKQPLLPLEKAGSFELVYSDQTFQFENPE
jgi:tubulin polyglutamylase TTLL2